MTNMKFDKIDDNYNYLIKMPADSVSEENVEKILKEQEDLSKFLEELKCKTVESIWLDELDKFEKNMIKNIVI